MPKKKTKKTNNFQDRVEKYVSQDKKLLEKHNINKMIVVLFPRHRKPPKLGVFALRLLKWSGGVVDLQFIDNEK